MRFFILILILCISNASLLERKPKRFAWNANKKLHWSDFKGIPDYSSPYAATVNSGMSHSYGIDGRGYYDKENSKILAHFYPTFSWYKPEDSSQAILRHEQAHFDITEIHARKLRKRIAQFSFTQNSEKEARALYEAVESERLQMQQNFDHDTKHSQDKQQEFIWESKIAQWLEELEAYAYP